MNRCSRLAALAAVLSLASGCAHGTTPKERRARILMAIGGTGVVVGTVVASGCGLDEGGCSDPSPPQIGAGIPLVVAGGAVFAAGLITHRRAAAQR